MQKEDESNTGYLICDGKKDNNSFLPLSIGNKWVYENSKGETTVLSVTDYVTIQNKVYFKINQQTGNQLLSRNIRMDGDGDIYERILGNDQLFLPFKCINNQSLPMGHSITQTFVDRKVINKDSDCRSSRCNYKKCIQVQLTSNGAITGEYYLKKGLGIVYERITKNGIEETYSLISAEIN